MEFRVGLLILRDLHEYRRLGAVRLNLRVRPLQLNGLFAGCDGIDRCPQDVPFHVAIKFAAVLLNFN